MGPVDSYSNLDVSQSSTLFKTLKDSLVDESSGRPISLTGAKQTYDARQPARLTPAMSAWYMANVAGLRTAAISSVNNAIRADKATDGGAASIYLEVERDKIRSTGVRTAVVETERFLHKNKDIIEKFEQYRFDFNTMKAGIKREPVRTKTWLYVIILLALVLLEAFINFESFMRVPYITSPFLATGATMAVALGIAVSAHFHGIVLRQWNYLFSPQMAGEQDHKPRMYDAIRRVAIGSLLLFLALLMVAGSRYYYLRDYILQAQILGTSAPSMTGGIIFMLFGNMVAYVVALSAAYWMHDPNPIYAEKDRELEILIRKLETIKKRRLASQETIRAGTENELSTRANQDSSARGPRYNELRQLADAIDTKDQEVIGALLTYRTLLVKSLSSHANEALFRYPGGSYDDLLPVSADIVLTPEDYASMPLLLGFMIGEN